jgi:plasmid stability protein
MESKNGSEEEPSMPVTFSIKNVPDEVAEALRERARRNHRSLQGELMAIVENAVSDAHPGPTAAREARAAWNVSSLEEDQDTSSGTVESAVIDRQIRDGRTFTVQDLYEYVRTLNRAPPSRRGDSRRPEESVSLAVDHRRWPPSSHGAGGTRGGPASGRSSSPALMAYELANVAWVRFLGT